MTGELSAADAVAPGVDAIPGFPTFLRVPMCEASPERLREQGARAAFFGATVDTMGFPIRPGAAQGPNACRLASLQYDGCTTLEYEIDVREYWNLVDCGNVSLAGGNQELFLAQIEEAAGAMLDAGALPIMCGGDHSIPIAGVAALSRAIHGKVGYLHIDAHLDTHDEVGGSTLTMASPVIRIVESQAVDPKNVVVLGARGMSYPPREIARARSLGIRIIPMFEVVNRGLDEVLEEVVEHIWAGTDAVYVSFDNDSMDASYAPGTTGPEPCGFTSREMLTMAVTLGSRGVAMMDVAELSPGFDPAGITARLDCYWIIYVLSSYAHAIEQGEALPPVYARSRDAPV